MKIVILSDIHGNYDALSHLPEYYDQLWVLGDLVNYGPQPREVLRFVGKRATHVVRGNHDHSVGFGEAPRCSSRLREMAAATQKHANALLTEGDKEYLRSLPLYVDVRVGKASYRLCHSLPSDPPFTHHSYRSAAWEAECRGAGVDLLLVAHGHAPFATQVGSTLVANPGSLGQPRSGESVAYYCVLIDGRLGFRSFRYPINGVTEKIRALPISAAVRSELIEILRTGLVPKERVREITVGSLVR